MSAAVRAALVAALVVSACKSAPEPVPEPKAPPPPKAEPLELTKAQVVEQSLLEATLELSGKVGPVVTDRTLSWSARTGELSLGEGEVEIAPAADGTFTAPVTLTFGEGREDLAPFQDRESIEIVVEGTLGEGAQAYTASRSPSVRSPLLPAVTITSVQASRDTPGSLALTYLVTIKNPNPFDVRVSTLEYTAGLGGKTVASGDLPLGSRIPASAESMFELPAQLNAENAGKDFGKMIRQPELEWTFSGQLNARKVKVPFDLKGMLPLAKG